MMTIADFYNHVQLVLQTRGYEAWQGGEANLLITRGMVGRLSNTPNVGFAYEIQGVTDGGKMYIGDNWFRIPYTYSFPFHLGGRIQMIIGCNFIRSMNGGVRIEGDSVTEMLNSSD